jgi:hypothetical protein
LAPLAEDVGLNEPPPLVTVQVTPELEPSFATVELKVCVAPPIIATGVVLIATLIGERVTVAVPVLVGSVLLVAVMVAESVEPITAGAV